jgi:hypothetical protein
MQDNRYKELNKMQQHYIDRLINHLAASGSLIRENEYLEVMRRTIAELQEYTRAGMRREQPEEDSEEPEEDE